MIFVYYLTGWALYRAWKWFGYLYGQRLNKQLVTPLGYWTDYWPLVMRDLIVQVVIGLAWLSGMLNKALLAAYAAVGWEAPEIETPMTACLVGFVVASALSTILVKHLPAGPAEPSGEPTP